MADRAACSRTPGGCVDDHAAIVGIAGAAAQEDARNTVHHEGQPPNLTEDSASDTEDGGPESDERREDESEVGGTSDYGSSM